ncbi:hypothetical protein [Egbenema bharatensis]|uniref:hypothetical protein n=1 Tax=Egbenema bharatensis TaxID=3463334 RepID=UPI003A873F50
MTALRQKPRIEFSPEQQQQFCNDRIEMDFPLELEGETIYTPKQFNRSILRLGFAPGSILIFQNGQLRQVEELNPYRFPQDVVEEWEDLTALAINVVMFCWIEDHPYNFLIHQVYDLPETDEKTNTISVKEVLTFVKSFVRGVIKNVA